MSDTNNVNIDELLDGTLDDLADMPEFKVYPAGAHRVTVSFEKKEINKHPSVEMKFKLLETVEMSDPSEVAPEVGTESSVAFMLDNELGQGKLKEMLKVLSAHFGPMKNSELMEQAKGLEVLVVTKTRQNKEKTATYLDVVSMQVL